MSAQPSANQLVEAAKALAERMPKGEALRQFHARDEVVALRNALESAAEILEMETVAADYDKALCEITMNLDEPRSAKTAQKVLDKYALGTPQ